MYAIAEINGKQYKLEKGSTLNVDKLDNNAGDELAIDKILLYSDGDTVLIGRPYLKEVKISATITGNVKGKKVRGVKFKKRKNYTRTLSHRPQYSQVLINDMGVQS